MIGKEASLDEASRPELAVIKRFALATSLRMEQIVTLSWPQVDWENREVRLMQKGQHYRTIPLTPRRGDPPPAQRAPYKMALFMFVARPGAQQGRRRHPRRRDWLELGGVGFHDPCRTAAERMDREKAAGEEGEAGAEKKTGAKT